MKAWDKVKEVFKPKTGKAKTIRMARNFCAFELTCCVIAVYCSLNSYWTYTALAILAELFEWRFFSLSLRLRRYEEKTENKK